MPRYRLVVAYLGTAFHGWQRQPGLRTVQGALDQALATLSGDPDAQVVGASRTDAGVHAEGQVVALDYQGRLGARELLRAFNGLTPDDLTVRTVDEVPQQFHPRFDSLGKRYRYLLLAGRPCPPTLRGRVWWLRKGQPLDLDAMREAAAHLIGEHDFAAFRASDCEARTTLRRIDRVELTPLDPYLEARDDERGALLALDVYGNAFLKNMVRIIAGTLVEVGQGRRTPQSVAEALASGDRTRTGTTAPAEGLTLVRVFLPDDPPPAGGA